MNIESIVQMLIKEVAKNPELITRLLAHPYSTIGNVTDNNNVSKEEASQVVTAMSALMGGQQVDFGSLAGLASQMLSQNDDSVHSLADALLGSGSSKGVDVSEGISKDLLSGLASGVDLSDGLDAKDIMGLVGSLLK